jgi:molybdopterin-synthase adenylyltransferase
MSRNLISARNKSFNLLDYLADSKFISNPRLKEAKDSAIERRGATIVVEGNAQIDCHSVTIQIGVDAMFPQSLPLIFLVPWNAVGFIPHIDSDGYICYAQIDGLLLNRRDPTGIIDEALRRAIIVVEDGIRGKNSQDFVDEFDAYWRNLKDIKELTSVVTPDDSIREIIVIKKENTHIDKNAYEYATDDVTNLRLFCNANDAKQLTHRKALYIPLMLGTFIMPPLPHAQVDINFFRDIVSQHITKKNRRKLIKFTQKPKMEEVIVFGLPRPSGGYILFGVLLEGIKGRHPLLSAGDVQNVYPLAMKRRDKDFLLPRGGANKALQEKRVLLFGCGSVGGFLAFELIRSGVLEITLVDKDTLNPENTFRHVLGKNLWGLSKAEAMRQELQQKFPYVKPFAYTTPAEEIISLNLIDPKNYDLILVAIGDDTTSLFLNEKFRGCQSSPPVLYTWLEPFGIGGHVLVMHKTEHADHPIRSMSST